MVITGLLATAVITAVETVVPECGCNQSLNLGRISSVAKIGANLVSDRKLISSRNLGCALVDFYDHYSPRDLHSVMHMKVLR